MKKVTRLIMGMPVTIAVDASENETVDKIIEGVFDYFLYVDEQYSPYKETSEVSKINAGLPIGRSSKEMQKIIELCEETKQLTHGYFDIWSNGIMDPSGLVKGWAIDNVTKQLQQKGIHDAYIEAGGDIQVIGHNERDSPWRIGIRHPFNYKEIIKTLALSNKGIATSGTAIRGKHIYNPVTNEEIGDEVVSLTVIGPNIYEADRFATAAFAMGKEGIVFLQSLPQFEAYMVTSDQQAIYTKGFERLVV